MARRKKPRCKHGVNKRTKKCLLRPRRRGAAYARTVARSQARTAVVKVPRIHKYARTRVMPTRTKLYGE